VFYQFSGEQRNLFPFLIQHKTNSMSKRDKLHQLPLYQKAEHIFKITQGLIEIVPTDNEFLQETTVRFMLENAMIIPAKIAGA
jgi:hypothetical protein